jgi:thiol:disulfide interchange protein DsbD
MRRLALLALIIFSLGSGLAKAQAWPQSTDGVQTSNAAVDPLAAWKNPSSLGRPLPADEAFIVSVETAANGQLALRMTPAPGYMIYRTSIVATSENGVGVKLLLPDGQSHPDGGNASISVFKSSFTVPLSVDQKAFAVRFQGCQDNGICYPPMTRQMLSSLGGIAKQSSEQGAASEREVSHDERKTLVEKDGGLNLAGLNWAWLTLFGGGILLAFTPCVLPMLPVTLALVAGQAQGRKRAWPVLAYATGHASVWGIAGAFAALSGGAWLSTMTQSPLWLGLGILAFIALAASQLGWFSMGGMERWIPAKWHDTASQAGKASGLQWPAAMATGALTALLLGPCAAPLLAGALLYAAQQHSALQGAASLGLMGLGACMPMLALALGFDGGLRKLRGASIWMPWLGAGALLAVAGLLASRLLPEGSEPWLAAAWAALMGFEALRRSEAPMGSRRALAGIMLVVGLGSIGAGLNTGVSGGNTANSIAMTTVKSGDLDKVLSQAHGPIVIELVADWCTTCKRFAKETLTNAGVRSEMSGKQFLRVDLTGMSRDDEALLGRLGLVGPPTVLFFSGNKEIAGARLVGFEYPEAFIKRVRSARNASGT